MTYQGPEARYTSRFAALPKRTGQSIKDFDSAGNVTEHLTVARASLKAQDKNIATLFATATELVEGINTVQQMIGHTFVKNLPAPTSEIKDSPSKQLGYIQLSLRFFQAGVVHFMEQMSEANERIEHLEGFIGKLAVYDEDVSIIGELESLDLETLDPVRSAQAPREIPKSVLTPPITPTKVVAKSEPKGKGSKK